MARKEFRASMRIEDATPLSYALERVQDAEAVGKTLLVHRTIVRNADGPSTATGDRWVVSLKGLGLALVSGIETRDEARKIARRLLPTVDAFKAAVLEERKLLRDSVFGF